MIKVTFMGAGSTIFARNVLGDIMTTPALKEVEIALYDIDSARLNESLAMLNNINRNTNAGRAKIAAYLGVENRRAALKNANYVVNAIQVGGYDPCTITDFTIAKNMVFSRLLPIPWALAVSSARCAPYPCCLISHGILKPCARTPGC
jgi:alpha-galactosidase